MKNLRFTGVLLLAATMAHGQGEPSSRSLLSVPLVTLESETMVDANPRLVVGMRRGIVVGELGEPSFRLSRDVWVYFDFRATNLPGREQRDALVVAFINEAVSVIRLTDAASVRALIARQKQLAVRSAAVASR